ncbi:hypothetical protein B0A55_01199 [Friedmanniomyces simplex]|uniref:Uncharacterized protein n=1 Tax=Friedmanniomyces simplex TaxID=329884 RepID=A0A4U0XX77_9PEZI|nr:hypothetical protein B0A55_01199 [Friedmanniomyces simplex]
MGPADAGLRAFPSPASPSSTALETPTINSALAGGGATASAPWSPRSLLPDASQILPTEPTATFGVQALMSPPLDLRSQPDMNLLVGGALAPVHTIAPERPQPKSGAGAGLRLPSFEALGIAAPHPDRFGVPSLDGATSESGRNPLREPLGAPCVDFQGLDARAQMEGPAVGGAPNSDPLSGGRAVQSPLHQFISVLTPPADVGERMWAVPMDTASSDTGGVPATVAMSGQAASGVSESSGDNTLPPLGSTERASQWIDGAMQALLLNLRTAQIPSNPLRVLSHALPSPSSTGHVYPSIIGAIHETTPSSPTQWINVFHAIPGRFNLADLPTSPPATPGPPITGEDYFTQKTFDSAVPISDYQGDLSALPRSPRPVVPPSSINISIVERYIPPTSPNEFVDMFNPNGPSILVDRLVELSPDNGCLTFIYPTKTGALTFMNEYLDPLISPLLRTMCVVHGLSSDLSRILGSMSAVDRLLEHAEMERHIGRLCATLTQRSTGMHRFHGRRAAFALAYSARRRIPLSREVWARDWWSKQEKPRVREVVTRYAQEAQKKSSNEHIERPATPAELIQHLLDRVVHAPYPEGMEPVNGVEVGVFVIKRSD